MGHFKIDFESKTTDVPSLFPNVEGVRLPSRRRIQEYTFDDNFECTPQINMLSWTLSNGINSN
jgi:hypothetical protein